MDKNEVIWKLRAIATEILAMGHLLKWQQLDVVQSEEVQSGVGEILERLGKRVRRVADGVEYEQAKGARPRK